MGVPNLGSTQVVIDYLDFGFLMIVGSTDNKAKTLMKKHLYLITACLAAATTSFDCSVS